MLWPWEGLAESQAPCRDLGISCMSPRERLPEAGSLIRPKPPRCLSQPGARGTPLRLGKTKPAAGPAVPPKPFLLGAANQKQIYSLSVQTVKSRNTWLSGRCREPGVCGGGHPRSATCSARLVAGGRKGVRGSVLEGWELPQAPVLGCPRHRSRAA